MIVHTIGSLKETLNKIYPLDREGLLFCIGTSFISKVIAAKTREKGDDIVPSHVAIVKGSFLYESTSTPEKIGNKKIPAGVRRYLLTDFYKIEKRKDTLYVFVPITLDIKELEKHIHRPYGKDIILDYLLKDGSDGDSKGLICSQYANLVTKLIDKECVNPVELYRKVLELEDKQ